MDEYKKLSEKIIVPSSLLCGLILSCTALSYNLHRLTITCALATSALLLITGILSFFCCRRYSLFFVRNEKLQYKRIFVLIISAVLLLFFISARISTLTNHDNLPVKISNFQAKIISVENKRAGAQIVAETGRSFDNPDICVVLFYSGILKLNKGDKVFIHKEIEKTNCSKSGSGFNKYSMQGIHYTAYIYDNDITLLQKTDTGFREKFKIMLNQRIERLYNEDVSAMVKALFTGNISPIKKKIILSFRNAGAIHVLSASGLHIGIAAGLPLFLVFFGIGRNKILIFSILTVSAYLYITDMPVSLVRASLMFYLFATQRFLHRKSNSINALMLAASMIIIIAPWDIYNLGFQLSFGATLGILLFYNIYMKSFRGLPPFLRKSFSLSISSQIFTIPLIIYHLGQLNTISLLSNIIIIPLTSLFMYLAFGAIILPLFIPTFAGLMIKLTTQIYNLLVRSADFFSGFNLNFFLNENITIVLMLLTISLIPLIPSCSRLKIKTYPVFVSFVLCSLYLRYPAIKQPGEIALFYRNSSLVINNTCGNILNLDIRDSADKELLLKNMRKLNIKVNVININNNSIPNLTTCKKITDDFVIDECRFSIFPELNEITKSLIFSLEADKTKISFPSD